MAGETVLEELGIQKSVLNDNRQQLQHVAGGSLKVIGSCYFSFNLHGYTCTEQEPQKLSYPSTLAKG